jgi:KDO2-lipid IV(A) lauroyltransferase
MSNLKYLIQFLIIIFLLILFKLLGLRISSILSGYLTKAFGPFFRSNNLARKNLVRALPNLNSYQQKKLLEKMWFNYGKILSEYIFIKNFRTHPSFSKKIKIINRNIIEKIKADEQPVIFISGHFNNFELMAMQIEKLGINLSVVYRPLNNIFLNPVMEHIRKKFICKNQIKKGISGTKLLLKHFKKKNSIALMIDQRVSEGIKVDLFKTKSFTTTIPAQFVKKFNAKIVPVYIERTYNDNFEITFFEPVTFEKDSTIYDITLILNQKLEKMILKNPDQWTWTHNKWK